MLTLSSYNCPLHCVVGRDIRRGLCLYGVSLHVVVADTAPCINNQAFQFPPCVVHAEHQTIPPESQSLKMIESVDKVSVRRTLIYRSVREIMPTKMERQRPQKRIATWYIPPLFAPNTEPLEPQTQHGIEQELHSQCLCPKYPLLCHTHTAIPCLHHFAIKYLP